MRKVQVSDDPAVVWLTPERCRAARALLNWTPKHLADRVTKALQVPVIAPEILHFEDFGLQLDPAVSSGVLAVLLDKVEFTTTEGEPGVVRKRHVGAAQGEGYVEWGGPRRRRPPL